MDWNCDANIHFCKVIQLQISLCFKMQQIPLPVIKIQLPVECGQQSIQIPSHELKWSQFLKSEFSPTLPEAI